MTFRSIAVLAGLLLSLAAAAQTPRRDGNWEITVDVELDGVAGTIPTRTLTQCITPDDIAAGPGGTSGRSHTPDRSDTPGHGALPGHRALSGHDAALPGSCSASDHKVDGNKVSWTFRCDTPQPMSGSGEIVYTDENAYKGSMTFTRDGKTMTMKYEGKRLGDCSAGSKER